MLCPRLPQLAWDAMDIAYSLHQVIDEEDWRALGKMMLAHKAPPRFLAALLIYLANRGIKIGV